MVDARTHDQAGSAAKVTCAVTQVMSPDTEGYSPWCGTPVRRFVSPYAMGIPHFAIRGSDWRRTAGRGPFELNTTRIGEQCLY